MKNKTNLKTRRRTREIDMLNGSLADKILLFSLPLILTSFMQQLFNAADSAVVGRFVGSEALAAVGGGGPIVGCILNAFIGISVGANVVIARAVGAGEQETLDKKIRTAVIMAGAGGLILAVCCSLFCPLIMEVMQIPEELYRMSELYLRIYFCGMPFQLLYNVSAAVLRSFGETRRPVTVITVSGAANLLLNLLFVLRFHWDVAGVAAATCIANALSAALLLHTVFRDYLGPGKWSFDVASFKEMLRVGVPAGLQGAVSSVSHLTLQASINSLGMLAMAATSVSINYESFATNILTAFGQATVTFTSQNMGAGNSGRSRRVLRQSMLLGCLFTAGFCFLIILTGSRISLIFTDDPKIINLAMVRIRLIFAFEFLNQIIECLSSACRGRGWSMTPAVIMTIGKCGARVAWVLITFSIWHSFPLLCLSYVFSWIITLAMLIPAYFRILRKSEAM